LSQATGKQWPGPDRHTKHPTFKLPRGTCDTHVHVFGPQDKFPFSPERSYTPEDCTLADLTALHKTLGVDRVVIVHGGAHGTDNSATLDALDHRPDTTRGIAVIRAGLPHATLADMHKRGMRGCRISTVVGGGAGIDQLEGLAADTATLDWHILLHFNKSSELVELAPRLLATGRTFVLDHMARIAAAEGVNSLAFQMVLRLLDTDRFYVKLASLYRLSDEPYPNHDMMPMIEAVVRARPDRLLWGSNWPHPICHVAMPNDGDLVDLIPLWMPDAAVRQHVLVDNPARLYGFGPITDLKT
jgi:2-pyrone-4,6-dicarboxylate lactonase